MQLPFKKEKFSPGSRRPCNSYSQMHERWELAQQQETLLELMLANHLRNSIMKILKSCLLPLSSQHNIQGALVWISALGWTPSKGTGEFLCRWQHVSILHKKLITENCNFHWMTALISLTEACSSWNSEWHTGIKQATWSTSSWCFSALTCSWKENLLIPCWSFCCISSTMARKVMLNRSERAKWIKQCWILRDSWLTWCNCTQDTTTQSSSQHIQVFSGCLNPGIPSPIT